MDWTNKVVLITGASSGIGRAMGIELSRRGASVGLLARRGHLLEEIVDKITEAGGHALSVPADVTDPQAVRVAVSAVRRTFGPIDILVANAGINVNTFVPDLCEKKIADLMNVNVLGVVNSVSAVLPEMVRREAAIWSRTPVSPHTVAFRNQPLIARVRQPFQLSSRR
jgi:NADP-dependent 3-hydroxy acid dehydrogenase YdfG